ncbi:hypothetical protein RRG08_034827 [Elysia crispata]|uniref:Uncharacterized protein n=1 Tax=Elysia crispata TaxID=231223 RepID=A0AAE1AM50_9GAST|nr:hypothetical protein RRG08_034827 [Elysia crispata]
MASPVSSPTSSFSSSGVLSTSSIRPSNLLHPDSVLVTDESAEGATGGHSGDSSLVKKGAGDDEEEEEITETKIIGVTETGVIRKRSFKRKLTKEERDKRGYGNDRAEYDKIAERVMSERFISSAMEGLRDRGKMLAFMHGDCLALLDKWEQKRQARMLRRQNQDRDFLTVVAATILLPDNFVE